MDRAKFKNWKSNRRWKVSFYKKKRYFKKTLIIG